MKKNIKNKAEELKKFMERTKGKVMFVEKTERAKAFITKNGLPELHKA